jgi:hypothetical protein
MRTSGQAVALQKVPSSGFPRHDVWHLGGPTFGVKSVTIGDGSGGLMPLLHNYSRCPGSLNGNF